MFKACIIGSSKIVYHHINAIQANNIELYSICSTRKISKNSKNIQKKFNIPKIFDNWKKCIDEVSKEKNVFFLVCPRVNDTFKIVKYIVLKKKIVFCEKPLSLNPKEIKSLFPFMKYVFIGYNRIFYKSVQYLKKLSLSDSQISVTCPEQSKKSFLLNSCHILSILIFVFNKLEIKFKIENKNFIYCVLEDNKKNLISLSINFKTPSTFGITIKNDKKDIKLNPIETMVIYNKITLMKKKNLNFYYQKKQFEIDLNKEKGKPGFFRQYKEFKKTLLKGKVNKNADLKLAFEVMNLGKKIVK
tara:strand:+ start:10751 stop:11653 length:903 start_codon:yes stop_codon:yes gene_type:complete